MQELNKRAPKMTVQLLDPSMSAADLDKRLKLTRVAARSSWRPMYPLALTGETLPWRVTIRAS